MNFCRPKQSRFKLPPQHGRAAPAIIVAAALLLSGVVFFVYTSKRLQEKKETPAAPPPLTSIPVTPAKEAGPKSAAKVDEAPKPVAPPAPKKPQFGFARPVDLAKDLAQSLARNDLTRAAELAAAADPSEMRIDQARALFEQLQTLGYKVGSVAEVAAIGQLERFTRLSIPLQGPEGSAQLRLQIDVERDEDMGWKIAQFRLPPELAAALATAAPKPAEPPANPAGKNAKSDPQMASATSPAKPQNTADSPPLFVVEKSEDALAFADSFVKKLLSHEFGAARAALDENKVSAQKLAGLCIVFEEGQYQLQPSKPLVMTAAGKDVSWVIAQVKSEKLSEQTEFGMELQRAGEDQPWRVVGLNLSDLLSSFASSAAKLGVPYTPIVKNPKGGESLALYFEYDEAGLHPRAQKQLQIVSALLKSDPNRRLRIAGHTDAMGEEPYNLRLSQQRAESVKKELVALGVTDSQIDTTGLGTAQPLGPNQKSDGTDDPEGRSKNRRAEIYLDF